MFNNTPGAANGTGSGLHMLRRLAQPPPAQERCGLCSMELSGVHRHLLEVAHRAIVCACDPCALRFYDVIGQRFKLIPRDSRTLPDFRLTDAQWESLSIPISLAFFFHSTPKNGMTALYPSPGGAVESLLPLSSWNEILADNPSLAGMEQDVEALLVNRVQGAHEYFIAPIDRCFELVGLIRLNWHGFSGGDEVWKKVGEFFAGLRPSRPAPVTVYQER